MNTAYGIHFCEATIIAKTSTAHRQSSLHHSPETLLLYLVRHVNPQAPLNRRLPRDLALPLRKGAAEVLVEDSAKSYGILSCQILNGNEVNTRLASFISKNH